MIRDNAGQINYVGLTSLGGVLVSIVGIILVGGAGMSKEKELPEEVKKATVAEYNFKLGLFVAIFSGLMSAAMNFGLQGGETIEAIACPLFTPMQFKEESLPDFVAQLKDAEPKKLPGFLFSRFTPETKDLVEHFSSKKGESARLEEKLCKELNQIIQKANIFQPDRGAVVKLSEETNTRLNRDLLEKNFRISSRCIARKTMSST